MRLEGSCHCGAVRFTLESAHPYPFNLCYCSICRKTAGGGGFAINLGGEHASLDITGREHVRVYRAKLREHIIEALKTFDRDPLLAKLEAASVPASPISSQLKPRFRPPSQLYPSRSTTSREA